MCVYVWYHYVFYLFMAQLGLCCFQELSLAAVRAAVAEASLLWAQALGTYELQ